MWLLSLGVVIALLAFGPTALLSCVWRNAGLLVLSRSLTTPLEDSGIRRAQSLLKTSLSYAPRSQYTWRELGLAFSLRGEEEEAIAAWRSAGDVSREFIQRGERYRKAGMLQDARRWHGRAVRLRPDLRDTWYYLGLTYETMGDLGMAEHMYEESLDRQAEQEVHISDVYFQLGQLQERFLPLSQWDAVLSRYDSALELDAFSDEATRVQVRYSRAEVLRKLNRKEKALEEYAWVVNHRPLDYWARVHLAFLVWELERNAKDAETLLIEAINIKSKAKWAYRGLGLIYSKTGRKLEAVDMYRRVLALDPSDTLAREQLDEIEKEIQ